MNEITGLKMSLDSRYEGGFNDDSSCAICKNCKTYWMQKSDKILYEVDFKTNEYTGRTKEYKHNRKW